MNFELTAAQLATQGDYQDAVSSVYTSMGEKTKAELKKVHSWNGCPLADYCSPSLWQERGAPRLGPPETASNHADAHADV